MERSDFMIFKSEYNESTNSWSKPEILQYPMNTPDDDIQFYIDPNLNSRGYNINMRNHFTYLQEKLRSFDHILSTIKIN